MPSEARLLGVLGIHLLRRDPSTGLRVLDRAVRLDPKDPIARFNLGTALSRADRNREALVHYRAASRLDPGDADAHFAMAETHLAPQRFSKAASLFQAGLDTWKGHEHDRWNLGIALLDLGKPAQAAEQFRIFARRFPDDAEGHAFVAVCLARTGDAPGARAAMARARRAPLERGKIAPLLREATAFLARGSASQERKKGAGR